MYADEDARREALRLVRRGAAASLLGGLAWAGWEVARAAVPRDALGAPAGWVRRRLGRDDDPFTPDEAWDGEDVPIRDLDDEVRVLADAMLSQTEDYGAYALRAQLARAETTDAPHDARQPIDFATFEVPDDVPLAVPADAEFPVRARFVGPDGEAYVVSLRVDQGRLGYLALLGLEGGPPHGSGPVRSWPRPDEVTFWIDTIKGPEPVLR